MKLEEVLPAYREGKTIVAAGGTKCQKDRKNGSAKIGFFTSDTLLGEWTIQEEPAPPRKMSPALFKSFGQIKVHDMLFTDEEHARNVLGEVFYSWPALDGSGNPIVVLVPEVGK